MAHGIAVRGSHGVIQIDQNYQNLFVRENGTSNVGTTANQGLGSLVTVTTSMTLTPTSLIALSGAVPVAVVGAASNSFQVYSPKIGGEAFNWWIFDKLVSLRTSGTGLVVRKPITLEPVFDDGQKPLRVLGQFTAPSPGFSAGLHDTTAYGTATYSGKTTGAVSLNLPSTTYSGPPSGPGSVPNYYYVACPRASANTVVGVTGRFTSFSGAPDVAIGTNGSVLVIDLTDYS